MPKRGEPPVKRRRRQPKMWDDTVEIGEDDMDTEFIIPHADSIETGDNRVKDPAEQSYLNSLDTRQRRQILDEELRLEKQVAKKAPIRYRIIGLNAPDIVKLTALQLLAAYERESDNGASFLTAVENICELPWGKLHQLKLEKKEVAQFLENSLSIMDTEVYGQLPAKLEIIEFINNYISNPQTTCVIGLCGPPGIGKTTLVKNALSRTLGDRPVYYMSLGGASDASVLTGHHPVWKGAKCGQMTNALIETKVSNPIIYIDELDKVSRTDRGLEIYDFLLHLTDPIQNAHIRDHFLGVNLDMSQCMFVFSYNDCSMINPILLDRITQINMNGFDRDQLITIAKEYVIPRTLKSLGLEDLRLHPIDDETIDFINNTAINCINDGIQQEHGVRPLNKIYHTLFSKLKLNMSLSGPTKRSNQLRNIYCVNIRQPILINKELVAKLLKEYY